LYSHQAGIANFYRRWQKRSVGTCLFG